MIYIIDACNLIFTVDEYGKLVDQNNFEEARFNLLSMLSCFSTDTNNKVIAVFDGALPGLPFGRHQKHGPIDVIYSLPDQTADLIIETKVATFARGECTVVTSDVNLRDECLAKGAKVLPCEHFPPQNKTKNEEDDKIELPFNKEFGLDESEVDYWMNVFGEEIEED